MSFVLPFTHTYDPTTGISTTSLLHEGMVYHKKSIGSRDRMDSVVKSFEVKFSEGKVIADGVVMRTEHRAFADENGFLYASLRQTVGATTAILEAIYSPIDKTVNTWKTELMYGIRTDFLVTKSYQFELPEGTSFTQYASIYLPSINSAVYPPKCDATFNPLRTIQDKATTICKIAAASGLLEVIGGADREGLLTAELREICIDLAAKHGHLHVVRCLTIKH